MLTENQKSKLINKITYLVRESIFENGYFENIFPEKKVSKPKKKNSKKSDKDKNKSKRDSILKWLDTAQELHSVLSYELWPGKDKDTARSEFSKKYRGHDNDGNPYSFDNDEINRLYNMRNDFIERAGLNHKGD